MHAIIKSAILGLSLASTTAEVSAQTPNAFDGNITLPTRPIGETKTASATIRCNCGILKLASRDSRFNDYKITPDLSTGEAKLSLTLNRTPTNNKPTPGQAVVLISEPDKEPRQIMLTNAAASDNLIILNINLSDLDPKTTLQLSTFSNFELSSATAMRKPSARDLGILDQVRKQNRIKL